MRRLRLEHRLAALEHDDALAALRAAAATASEPALRRLGATWRSAVLRAFFAPVRPAAAPAGTSGRTTRCPSG